MKAWKTIREAFAAVTGGTADLLLPEVCAACEANDAAADALCEGCGKALLSLVALPYCPRCGATTGPNVPARDDGCPACPATLPRYARTVRMGPYAEPLRSLIRELKYRRCETMCRRLGRLLGQAVATACMADSRADAAEPPHVVLSIPMHWRRRLARGSDHARLLARAVAAEIDLPLGDELIRVRHTPPQTHFSRTQRMANVRDAFSVRRAGGLAGINVLLVDDVTTTGATANEAARTLLAAGVNRVVLAVVAKAEPPTAYAEFAAV